MLFSGKGTPDCRRSFPIKCRACFGRVGLRDGYAVNGSSVFAESGFERNRSLFPVIVRIVVARLIYGGRLTIPAGFRERLCRTNPRFLMSGTAGYFRSAGEIWLRRRQVEKSLAAEHAFSRKASFPFVTTGKAARCRRPWTGRPSASSACGAERFCGCGFPATVLFVTESPASVGRKTDCSRCRPPFGENGNLRRCAENYSGMLPCFLGGLLRILLCAMSRA